MNHLVLIGFPRIGKTYYGKKLAQLLNEKCIDTDELIVEAYQREYGEKKTVSEIHSSIGETAFRELEKKQLFSISSPTSIIATGGGVVEVEENISFLTTLGKVVYLQLEKSKVYENLKKIPLPSYLLLEHFDFLFEKFYQRRSQNYQKAACLKLDITHLSELEVLKILKEEFEGIKIS